MFLENLIGREKSAFLGLVKNVLGSSIETLGLFIVGIRIVAFLGSEQPKTHGDSD